MSSGDHPARTPAAGEGRRPGPGPHWGLELPDSRGQEEPALGDTRSRWPSCPGSHRLRGWPLTAAHRGLLGRSFREAGRGWGAGQRGSRVCPHRWQGAGPPCRPALHWGPVGPGPPGSHLGSRWLRPSPGEGADEPPLRATASCTPSQPPRSRAAPGLPLRRGPERKQRAELPGTARHLGGARLLPLTRARAVGVAHAALRLGEQLPWGRASPGLDPSPGADLGRCSKQMLSACCSAAAAPAGVPTRCPARRPRKGPGPGAPRPRPLGAACPLRPPFIGRCPLVYGCSSFPGPLHWDSHAPHLRQMCPRPLTLGCPAQRGMWPPLPDARLLFPVSP